MGRSTTFLAAGAGPNVLIGGRGADRLTGRGGRDLLIGGVGVDALTGGAGDDLLIGGATSFDADEFALAAIQAELLSARSASSRLANVTGDSANPEFAARLNGRVYLQARAPSRTVTNDAAADTLSGAAGVDAFFANLDSGVLDALLDRRDRERAIDVN